VGRTISEDVNPCSVMARRPNREPEEILTPEQLKNLPHGLLVLSSTSVMDEYERAHRACKLIYHRLPSPQQMQTLVQYGNSCGSGVSSFDAWHFQGRTPNKLPTALADEVDSQLKQAMRSFITPTEAVKPPMLSH
jgi:hypothetical protein